jgi:predicted GIY-YIG superfamily endonuclease
MSSLNAVQVTAYCYVLECQARTDLPNAPASSFYVGSTSNVNMRIAQHFNGSGSRFTVAFKPIRVAELDVTPRLTAQEVLAFENETTLRYMEQMMAKNPDNPDAWRSVAGGSYCKIDQSMPHELRRRLSCPASTESRS